MFPFLCMPMLVLTVSSADKVRSGVAAEGVGEAQRRDQHKNLSRACSAASIRAVKEVSNASSSVSRAYHIA